MVVDDRVINREFLITLLSYGKHTLFEAENGEDALRLAKENHFDLIITDILMPNMNGYELAQKLQADPKLSKIPLIFYTATYRLDEANLLANSCGVKYVLAKPADPDLIMNTVNLALGGNDVSYSPSPQKKDLIETIKNNEQRDLNSMTEDMASYLSDVELAREALNKLLLKTEELAIGRDRILKITENISNSLKKFKQISSRLVTVSELNLDLVAEHDIEKLVKLFCEGSRKILGAKYAFLGILDDNDGCLKHYIASGADVCKNKNEKNIKATQGLIARILKEPGVFITANKEDLSDPSIITSYYPIQCLMAIRLITKTKLYGFIYYLDKDNGSLFTQLDANLIMTLAAEFSIIYENIELYDLIQRHAAKLQITITERNRAQENLATNELMFRQFAENINEVFWRISPSGKEVYYASPAYEKIWGYPVDDLYKNPLAWYAAILEEDKPKLDGLFTMAEDNIPSLEFEFRILRPDKKIRTILARATLLKEDNVIVGIIGIALDITIRDVYKHKIQDSLAEKEAMLKEIYHRVKNNLQVVSSLLNMQANTIEHSPSKRAFLESAARIKSMSLIHEMLYQSGNLAEIRIDKYLQKLTAYLADVFHVDINVIKLITEADAISLGIEQAIPCGLIVNELISNAFKHAFPNGREGEVKISLELSNNNIIMRISDNGIGLDEKIDFDNSTTLGIPLIQALTKQLEGSIKLESNNGTVFTLTFPSKLMKEKDR